MTPNYQPNTSSMENWPLHWAEKRDIHLQHSPFPKDFQVQFRQHTALGTDTRPDTPQGKGEVPTALSTELIWLQVSLPLDCEPLESGNILVILSAPDLVASNTQEKMDRWKERK